MEALAVVNSPVKGPQVLSVPKPVKRRAERLPFIVKLVETEEDLRKAVFIRHAAYARHLPEFAESLSRPEALDYEPGVGILLVESKLDGSPLGTARIQLNTNGPLCVEQSVTFPAWMRGQRLAEVTRLGVAAGQRGRLAKLALWKACFFYFAMQDVKWAIAAGRAPLDQSYLDLDFQDLFPEIGMIPLRHAGNVPHRVMGFDSPTAYSRWSAQGHPLLDFICHVDHEDVKLDHRPALRQIPPFSPFAMRQESVLAA
jgi:hypothetical protein